VNAELVECVEELGILCSDRCLLNLKQGANAPVESLQDKKRRIEKETDRMIFQMTDYSAEKREQGEIEKYISEFKTFYKNSYDGSKFDVIKIKISNLGLY
jgi:hypothetical protein